MLTRAVAEREQLTRAHQKAVSAEQDERVLEMARDFGKVWNAPTTSNLDRKRLLALLIEDATLTREGYSRSLSRVRVCCCSSWRRCQSFFRRRRRIARSLSVRG